MSHLCQIHLCSTQTRRAARTWTQVRRGTLTRQAARTSTQVKHTEDICHFESRKKEGPDVRVRKPEVFASRVHQSSNFSQTKSKRDRGAPGGILTLLILRVHLESEYRFGRGSVEHDIHIMIKICLSQDDKNTLFRQHSTATWYVWADCIMTVVVRIRGSRGMGGHATACSSIKPVAVTSRTERIICSRVERENIQTALSHNLWLCICVGWVTDHIVHICEHQQLFYFVLLLLLVLLFNNTRFVVQQLF